VFNVKEACRSIDLTKDSKYVVAAATTVGMNLYDISNGKMVA
jgi:translation initiation factor 3 subunit I